MKFIHTIFLFISSCWICYAQLNLTASTPPFNLINSGDRFYKDISYGNDIINNDLDIFIPESETPSALLLIIHGGGFINGDKADVYENTFYNELINDLLSRNIAVATINYYLVTENDTEGILRSLNDSKRALQFIRYHASELNIDKTKVAIYGTSAGAATALWIALRDDMADAGNSDPVLKESTRVSGLICGSPQANYDCLEWHNNVFSEYQADGFSYETVKTILGESRLFNYYGVSNETELFSAETQLYRNEVNMQSFMSGDDPEMYITSSVDYIFPTNSSELYHHPLHANTLRLKALELGIPGVYYIPNMGIDTRSGESTEEFLIRKIGKESYPPAVILGVGSNYWKLNSFNGLPGESAVYYDDITNLDGIILQEYEDVNYFYTDGQWVYFKCYVGLEASENSGNPRVELREMDKGNLANWDGSNGKHTMQWTVKVDQLPDNKDGENSGTVCVGQIHGPETNDDNVNIDDVIRVQVTGYANQSSGDVRLKISGYLPDSSNGGSVYIDNGYRLGNSYTFKLEYFKGKVTLYQIENNVETSIYSAQMYTATNGNYFKTGNYLQSVQGMGFDGDYGLVGIKNLIVSHDYFEGRIYVPDDAFEAYLEAEFADNIIPDGSTTDEYITFKDINTVTDIDFNSPNLAPATTSVKDLTGIKAFTALRYLIARNNDITGDVDLSGLSSLSKIYIDENPNLTGLNFTGCSSLQQVKASKCNLSDLDLSTTTLNTINVDELTDVDVDTNNLNELNISGHTGIDYLDFGTNANVTSIDISLLTKLTLLRFQKCDITGDLDISANSTLGQLAAYDNDNLTSIDLGSIPYTNFTYFKTNSSSLLTCIYTDTPSAYEIGGSLQLAIGSSYSVDNYTNFVLDESACNTLSIEGFKQSGVNIFPNPSRNNLVVSISDNATYHFNNINGQTLKQGRLSKGENTIKISNLSNGLYFLNITTDNGKMLIKKIVKQ